MNLWKKSSTKPQEIESGQREVLETNNKRSCETALEPQPSKKKRKRDKTAGLLFTLNKEHSKSVKNLGNLCQQTQSLIIHKTPNASSQPNKSFNINSNKIANKNTIKNKGNVQKGPNKKAKTVVQPPPKRHNMLLLANALKAKSSHPKNNSHEDKLKRMLR